MLGMLSRTILEINVAINKNPNCKYIFKCKPELQKPVVRKKKQNTSSKSNAILFLMNL